MELATMMEILLSGLLLTAQIFVDAFSEGVRPVYVSATGISHAKKNGLNGACMRLIKARGQNRTVHGTRFSRTSLRF